jgi:hypothetical protein
MEPGGSYYALGRAYAPLLLSFEMGEDNRIRVWAVNDTGRTIQGQLAVQRRDEMGREVMQTMEEPVHLEPDESRPVADLSRWGSFFRNSVLTARLMDTEGQEFAFVTDVMAPENICTRQNPELEVTRRGDRLELSCGAYARRVTLQGPPEGNGARGWLFSDNYFDLLPGRRKTVDILDAPEGGRPHVRWAGCYRARPVDELNGESAH